MTEEVYGFDREGFEAVVATVRRAGLLPPRRDVGRLAGRRAVRDTPSQWVKPTSASTSTVTLAGGGTTPAYPAKWQSYDSTTATWSDQDDVWLTTANGEAVVSGTRYLCRLAGADAAGKAIWGAELQAASTSTGLTVETTDGATVLSAISPPLIKVDTGLNLSGSGGSSGSAVFGLAAQYVYGTMSGSFSGGTALTLPSSGSGSNAGGVTNAGSGGVFDVVGGVYVWRKAGIYLATFHTTISYTVTGGGTFTSVSYSLSFSSNYDSAPNPANDGVGTAAEAWSQTLAASGTSATIQVSVVQVVSVLSDGTQVKISGTAGGVVTGGPLLVTAGATNPYLLWGVRLTGPLP